MKTNGNGRISRYQISSTLVVEEMKHEKRDRAHNITNLVLPPLEDGVVVDGGDALAVVEPRADLHVHHLPHVVRVTHSRRLL